MSSRPKARFHPRHLLLLAAWALALVISTITMGALRSHAAVPVSARIAASPSCGLQDNSACYSLNLAEGYIRDQDFSDLLELQTPTTITCPDPAYASSYCRGVNRTVQLELFNITRSGRNELLTRNQYVGLFKQFFAKAGPFHFGALSQSGTTAQLVYYNGSATSTYELLLIKTGSTWRVERPILSGQNSAP